MKEITLLGGESTGRKLKVKEDVDKVAVPQRSTDTPLLPKTSENNTYESNLDCSYYVKANLVFREVISVKPTSYVYRELVIDNIFVPESEKCAYENTLTNILTQALNTEWEVKCSD